MFGALFILLLFPQYAYSACSKVPECLECTDIKVSCLITLTSWTTITDKFDKSVTDMTLFCSKEGSVKSLKGLGRYNNLKSLNIDSCGLTEIEENTFEELTKLETLVLSKNPLSSTLHENTFKKQSVLSELHLDGTQLESLPDTLFDAASSTLIRLALGNNAKLSITDRTFKALAKLQRLTLSKINIGSIKKNYFSGLTSIDRIDLDNNDIKEIELNSFSMSKLFKLYLNDNSIHTITPGMFHSKMKKLNLKNNRITSMTSDFQNFFDNSDVKVYLSRNPFHCNCLVGWLRGWPVERMTEDTDQAVGCVSPPSMIGSFKSHFTKDFNCTGPTISIASSDEGPVCSGSGDPSPNVIWTFPDAKTDETQPPVDKSILLTEAFLIPTLTGMYTCTATSRYDNDDHEITDEAFIYLQPRPPTTPAPSTKYPYGRSGSSSDKDFTLGNLIMTGCIGFFGALIIAAFMFCVFICKKNRERENLPNGATQSDGEVVRRKHRYKQKHGNKRPKSEGDRPRSGSDSSIANNYTQHPPMFNRGLSGSLNSLAQTASEPAHIHNVSEGIMNFDLVNNNHSPIPSSVPIAHHESQSTPPHNIAPASTVALKPTVKADIVPPVKIVSALLPRKDELYESLDNFEKNKEDDPSKSVYTELPLTTDLGKDQSAVEIKDVPVLKPSAISNGDSSRPTSTLTKPTNRVVTFASDETTVTFT